MPDHVVARLSPEPLASVLALEALIDLGAREVEPETGKVHALFDHVPPGLDRHLRQLLGEDYQGIDVHEAFLEDWASVWRPVPRALRFGPIRVVPEGAPLQDGDLALRIGEAFGGGGHPTTSLCVDALIEHPPTSAVLDVGTGTGILALIALKLGAPSAVGTEIDPAAREIGRHNAALNGFADRFELRTDIPKGRTFERVVANILPGDLARISLAVERAVAPGRGELSLTGFPPELAAEVARPWKQAGFRLVGQAERDGWARIDLLSPGA